MTRILFSTAFVIAIVIGAARLPAHAPGSLAEPSPASYGVADIAY